MVGIYSPTSERLRTFVEKLSSALTQETEVVVAPGDSWAAYPFEKPPRLTYRLTDVAVIGEDIMAVTGHEIAHLLYTEQAKFKFDVSKKPRAAHLLLNVVEDARIERTFAEAFPGAQSLFDQLREGIYDYKVQRGFDDLPVKWRFYLNIDRVLHGLEPWGEQRDIDAVEKVLDDVIDAMMSDTTQEACDHLELAYKVLLDLMRLEAMEQDPDLAEQLKDLIPLNIPPELLGLPSDYDMNAPQDDVDEADQRSGEQTDHAFDQGADEDDHQVGGTDGTDGKRQKADGGGSGEGTTGKGEGESGEGVEGGSGDGSGGGNDPLGSGGGGATGGEDPWQGNDPLDETDEEFEPEDEDKVKPTNIIDEMVNEEAGTRNKAIDILAYRQRQRQKQAAEVQKKINREENDFLKELEAVFGQQRASSAFKQRIQANEKRYRADLVTFNVQIKTLHAHARNILRDNAMERFGGNHQSGRKVKTNRLYRTYTDDLRLFERKEFVGGKSYDICLVVDQSTSMNTWHKQTLAYQASLIFLEAFDGLAGTSVIGFSDMGFEYHSGPGGGATQTFNHNTGRYEWGTSIDYRVYKGSDSILRRRWAAIPELDRSYNSTPMESGVAAAVEQLRYSMKEVRAMVVVTDGQPNDPDATLREFMRAKRLGIACYGLHIGGRAPRQYHYMRDSGLDFLVQACDRAVRCNGANDVPNAVNRLLRGIIRSRRVA